MLKRWRWVGDFRGFGGHVSVLIWFFFFNLKKKKKKKKKKKTQCGGRVDRWCDIKNNFLLLSSTHQFFHPRNNS